MRFLTYNIRHGEGVDGWVSNKRIAAVIRAANPDVAGLNEVWSLRGIWDQPALIAEYAGLVHRYEPNHVRWVHSLGNAVMTRGELVSAENLAIPRGIERRGALVAEIDVDGQRVTFVSTHLSLGRATRARQFAFLAENLPHDRPLVLAGDFNCRADQIEGLAPLLSGAGVSRPTFPSVKASRDLDHILFSEHWRLEGIETFASRASDHLPLVAELTLR